METQQQNIRSWEDLIFENRNKAYGAYAIRQNYNGAALKGILISTGIAAAIIILATSLNGKSIIPIPDSKPIIFDPKPPPIIQADVKPATPRTEPQENIKRDLTPVASVKPDSVVATQPEPTPTSSGTEGTGEGTPTEGIGTGAGVPNGTGTDVEPVKPPQILTHAQLMPAYKTGYEGMMRVITRNLKYPSSARRMGKEGTVFVEFVIDNSGNIQNTKVIKGFDTACDKEAVRIVNMLTDWNPGMQNEVAVNVKLVLPIKFKLEQ